ncbi:DUF7373 family lipoprotein [Mycobacterium heidelbergense]|uniref:DUF7373 family lipoprotein n=1 Tax=Mycobacterium heidelbergense TaxID=53376 RepID=UPI003CFB4749
MIQCRAKRRPPAQQVLVAALSATIVLSAGCTSVVAGSATKSGGPAPPAANLALLDPGNYPRAPRPALGTVPSADAGARVEAQRMADIVVGPWDVDRKLIAGQSDVAPTTALPDAAALTALVFGASISAQASGHHFVVGFVSGRKTVEAPAGQPTPADKPKILDNAVLRFPTPQDAQAAVTEMAAANLALPREGNVAPTRLQIPGHPTTLANIAAVSGGFEAESFTAHGMYVCFQYAGSKESADVVADMIGKTLDLQAPLIDHFQPTPLDQLAAMNADPTGLLARTVPTSNPGVNQAAVYEPRGALHFRPDPPATQTMFDDAGIQHVAVDRTTVYEAVDATGATRAVDGLVRIDVPYLGYKSAPGISGLPSARCWDRGPSDPDLAALRYLCIAAGAHYAFKATAAQELDAHQVMAAQYLMLVGS